MNTLRASALGALLIYSSTINAGIGTTVPVSAEVATSVAHNLFPVTVKLIKGNLFLTDPTVLFLDKTRIGMRVRFQAYHHQPAEGIAISETGRALISGELDFDLEARQILLHEANIDTLKFDRENDNTKQFTTDLRAAWSAQVTNPIRSAIPPHPYLLPFKENIQDVSYDGERINLRLVYQ